MFLVRDLQLQRNVALKLLPESVASDKERLRRFEREARAASALNHPNVAQIHEVGESEGKHFIVMEYVEGTSLQTLVDQKTHNPTEILDYAIQLADALDEAHVKGIIHRDLKPTNVMLNQRRQIKILDFGLAKILQQSPDEASAYITETVTEKGMILGTVPYMSPEQALGKSVDHRTDIFSFGTLLYTLLTGRHPFSGMTQMESLDKVLHAEPEPVSKWNPEVDTGFDRIIRKCMEKDLNSRYQSVREILVDLKNLRRDTTIVKDPSGPKNTSRFAPVVISILMITGAVAIFFLNRSSWNIKPSAKERITLAVMPFHVVTPDPEVSYLSIGIPDSIITRLSNLEQLQLRPTSSILPFQNKPFDLQEIQKTLRVENVLTGTIQKSGDQMRVRAQLIRANDGVSLWGGTFDVSPADLLTIEDSVSDQVSSALQIQMSPEQRVRLKEIPTGNAEAYEWYLRGREQLLRYNTDAALNAISNFEKALHLDPTFAKARAGLAQAAADMHIRFASDDQVQYWGQRAMQEAKKSVQMNPNLAEAHEAMAAVYRKADFKWDLTIEESNKALKLNNSLYLPHYYKSAAYYHLGLFDLAEKELQEALKVNVSDRVEALRTQAIIDFVRGRSPETIRNLKEVQKLTGKPLADWYLSQAYYYTGQLKEAEALLHELNSASYAGTATRAKASLAAFSAKAGRKQEAQELLDEALQSSLLDHHAWYSIGIAHVYLGKKDQAIEYLNKSIETGFPCYPWFQKDPLLDPLRNSKSFQELLSRLEKEYQKALARYS